VLTVDAGVEHHLVNASPGDLLSSSAEMYDNSQDNNVFTIQLPTAMNNIILPPSDQAQIGYANDFARFNFRLQSMLMTMKKEHIRSDFLGGRIVNVQDHNSILKSMDIIHDILLSDWCVHSTERDRNHNLAVDHARALYEKAQENFPLTTPQGYEVSNYTYAAWYEAIEEICSSPYWVELMNEGNNQRIVCKWTQDPQRTPSSRSWASVHVKKELSASHDEGVSREAKPKVQTTTPRRTVSSAPRVYSAEKRQQQLAAGVKLHQCPECHYATARMHVLETHINTVHKGLKPYKCEDCTDSFGHASTLKSHVNAVHKGLKPYKCTQCSNAFAHSSTLRIHIRTVHKGEKPYKCDLCSYSAGQSTNLRTHINHVHKGIRKNASKRASGAGVNAQPEKTLDQSTESMAAE